MSIHVISRVLPKRWGSPSRKIVAIKLADVAREDGTSIYPSISTVASEAELSERQVQRIIDEFRKAGLVIVVKQGGGRNRPTEYRFNLDAIDRLPDAKPLLDGDGVEQDHPADIGPQSENPSLGNGDTMSPFKPERVTSATGKGDTHVTQPVITRKYPYGEADASREPASLNAQVWKEALSILSQSPLPDSQKRTLIGKWLKRAPDKSGKEKFRAILAGAKRAGTGDPVPYITRALDRELPLPPDPKTFGTEDWRFVVQAVINTKDWNKELWGKPPGKKGCLVPPELITDKLLSAIGAKSASPAEGAGITTPLAERRPGDLNADVSEIKPAVTGKPMTELEDAGIPAPNLPNSRNFGNSPIVSIAERRP